MIKLKKINLKLVIPLLIIIIFLLINSYVFAEEELSWREELMLASQALEEENNKTNSSFNQLGMVLSTFGSDNNLVNPGLRFSPMLMSSNNGVIRAVGEVFYLHEDEEIAAFLSLSYETLKNIYFGAGAELTDKADYHAFLGYNINDNIFIEARYIEAEESKVYPFLGLQLSF